MSAPQATVEKQLTTQAREKYDAALAEANATIQNGKTLDSAATRDIIAKIVSAGKSLADAIDAIPVAGIGLQ